MVIIFLLIFSSEVNNIDLSLRNAFSAEVFTYLDRISGDT